MLAFRNAHRRVRYASACETLRAPTFAALSQLRARDFFRIEVNTVNNPVYFFRPDGSSSRLELPVREDGNSFDLSISGDQLALPGAYEIRFGGGVGNEESVRNEWFAVNADSVEGNLSSCEPEELREVYSSEAIDFVSDELRVDLDRADQSTGEIWRSLLWAVLFLLLAESLLARWFGRVR